MSIYLDKPLVNFLNDLATPHPTPGGGSAAAVSGALGAGLTTMVIELTRGKADDEAREQELSSILQEVEDLRLRFQSLLQEDIDAYGRLAAAYKLPRETAEEREARSQAIQERLLDAAQTPLEIAECAADLVLYCQRIAEIGAANVISDVAAGAMLAASAGTAASWMVRVNLKHMKDLELANVLSERLSNALDKISSASQQVITTVGARA